VDKPCGCKHSNPFTCAEKRTLDRIPCSCSCHLAPQASNLETRLREISETLICRGGMGHYCPNCDNTTFGAAMSLRLLADQLGAVETAAEPCQWDRMFGAWVKHQAGLPSDVPLWPNPDWPQDVAMVAHALATLPNARPAPETRVEPEPGEDIEWRDCEIAFNAIQNNVGSETAHLKPAEQFHVFKRVARSLEKDCDDMVREAASAQKSTAPRCPTHGVELAFDGDECWECVRDKKEPA
jgi:hypothetical protein